METSIALMIFGEPGSDKNVFTEAKYKKLAQHFVEKNFNVTSICYHDSLADVLSKQLLRYDGVLVWVNPIEQQGDRKRLDRLLQQLSMQGVFVSAHPDVILKIGTKEILHKIKDEEFGMDVKLYTSFDDFRNKFQKDIDSGRIRILKQYRGNGGKGVYKVDTTEIDKNKVTVTHAAQGDLDMLMTVDDFYSMFEPYFQSGDVLINQQWNANIINGMVRCYVSGNKVAGFGYQEINALYPKINSIFKKPSQRFYFSEDCGLFGDLKQIMETKWIQRLQEITGIGNNLLPVIWDADFFINESNIPDTRKKYSLCEINVSSVSPFPESAIPYIVEETTNRIQYRRL
jgi:hypothetical protein